MREAIGEANITVITVILIGIILPVFYVIIPRLLNSMQDRACCVQNNGYVAASSCNIRIAGDGEDCSSDGCFSYELSGFRSFCD